MSSNLYSSLLQAVVLEVLVLTAKQLDLDFSLKVGAILSVPLGQVVT